MTYRLTPLDLVGLTEWREDLDWFARATKISPAAVEPHQDPNGNLTYIDFVFCRADDEAEFVAALLHKFRIEGSRVSGD